MSSHQDIVREIEALKHLNDYLVDRVYGSIEEIESSIRKHIGVLRESGVPVQVCDYYTHFRYELKDCQNFRMIYKLIREQHLPDIRSYAEALSRQYMAAAGEWMEVGMKVPEVSKGGTEVRGEGVYVGGAQDFSVQCHALCDLMDNLVYWMTMMKDVQAEYVSCCNNLVEMGVPKQIWSHYDAVDAKPLVALMNCPLLTDFADDYRYLKGVYDEISESLRELGVMYYRSPKGLPD